MLAIITTHPIQYQVPLWQALAREGTIPFEVWYLSRHGIQPSPDAEFKKSFAWDLNLLAGYPHEFLRTNRDPLVHRFWGVRLREDLRKRFREKGVKALWIQGWQVFAYWQAVWQAHEAGVEIWLRGESNDLAPPFWKKLPKMILLDALFQKVDRFLYIGRANRRLYEKYGVPKERLHPALYCVDNERFAKQATELLPKQAEIRREWKIPEEAFCILFAGKFIPKKRPLDLVKALSKGQFGPSTRPVHLLFAGSGELGEKLREACHVVFDAELSFVSQRSSPDLSLGYSLVGDKRPSASFVGFLNQTEISKAYVTADCLALPSDHRETWGLVVNEAMASGLPCIVSKLCGSCEDLVAPLERSFCFSVGDVKGLARAIGFVMDKQILQKDLQEQIRNYSLKENIKTVCSLYEKSLK